MKCERWTRECVCVRIHVCKCVCVMKKVRLKIVGVVGVVKMFWLLKHVQASARHKHPDLQIFHIPSLCHLRRRSPLRTSYL